MEANAFDKIFARSVPHIVEKIFLSLDLETYRNCCYVCKAWNDTLSSESFDQKAEKILAENNRKLMDASLDDDTDEVKMILSQGMVDVNYEDLRNCPDINTNGCSATPLKNASSFGNKAMVELLLEAGADQLKNCSTLTTFIITQTFLSRC